MLLWTIFKVAFKSLTANKLRSVLAMLGIIIGVAAVISMLAIGTGAQKQVMERMSAMGTNLLVVRPGQRGSGGVMSGTQQNLTLDDARALLDGVPGVESIAPVVSGSAQLKYFNKNSRTSVIGTTVTYFPIRSFEIEKGRAFTEREADRGARVAVIGPATAEDLFGSNDPLGETVKVKGINFTVVGVTKSKGDQGWFNPDDQVIVPVAVAMKQLFGLDYVREIDLQVAAGASQTEAQAQAEALLAKRHRIPAGTPSDVNIRNQAEMVEAASSFATTFTILLGGIAGISLVVGGIGIMNIMLVTVTERTREIGVRKAIGAKDRHILLQFLIESMIMSALGGLIGVGVGYGASQVVRLVSTFPSEVSLPSVLLSLGFASAVGIFFGYYPAHNAARLDPIEALRYE